MRIFIFVVACLFAMPPQVSAQSKPAYQFFAHGGKKRTYNKAFRMLRDADVVFFGELHNNAIAHWLEFEVLKDLTTLHGADNMVAGAEMFETDQQPLLSQYLEGKVERKEFEAEGLWPNYPTDYRPVVEFAKANGIPFIATNAPRTYARLVSRNGAPALDTLSTEEKALLTPLPYEVDYELPGYAGMRTMFGGHGGSMNIDYLIAAQALKDATMADRINRHWAKGKVFYHLNGSYHSDNHEGIVWYLRRLQPQAKIVTITTVEQDQLDKLDADYLQVADLILVVPSSMTKTYLTGME